MSLKEQEIYLKSINYLKKKNANLSLLFGVFSHNVTDDQSEDKIKSINLSTKFFIFNDVK